ncbi:6-phospho-3-hexuloisomerase [Methanovulcanius yangii]|uniref:6-phospho-3-hexuloisomerase n=1 Tax=Methanovulcanius yangii TaxID=1789227 RepID=UPI0029C9D34F|nr:6-phospho-3-hexuloisomerase [Methanovulcanius yangii]
MAEYYSLQELMRMIAKAVEAIADTVSDQEAREFVGEVLMAKRIYVTGAGRSGLMAKAFAMRLMHLGFESYVVGETITPAMHDDDLLVAFSGSGETRSIADICRTAQTVGGTVALITTNPDSTVAQVADLLVVLNSNPYDIGGLPTEFGIRQLTGEHRSDAGYTPKAPIGSIYETAAGVFADSVIIALMQIRHCGMDEVIRRYANIQ